MPGSPRRKHRLERRYGSGGLHFITCSCYRRKPLLGTKRARDLFLKILAEVRARYDFALIGYVVMPEHIHLLMSEPTVGTPSTVMQVLKQRVSRAMRKRKRRRSAAGQLRLWEEGPARDERSFWQRRFYDFNVWTAKKAEREDELYALQPGEERFGGEAGRLGMEQLGLLRRAGARAVSAESGVEGREESENDWGKRSKSKHARF